MMLRIPMLRELTWATTFALAALVTCGANAQLAAKDELVRSPEPKGPLMPSMVTKDELLRSLKPSGPATRSLRTRQIVVVPGKEAEVLDKHKDLPKISLSIEFKFNSDRLTEAGDRQLHVLADALRDPTLRGYHFLLAGHTDARGSAEYNQRLSERRALAVKDFLVVAAHLDPAKLSTVGFGEQRMLDPQDPDSPRNRRVEVINLLQ
jgi:outer membrane protein OmpA-like peptidoglycan-associated protein